MYAKVQSNINTRIIIDKVIKKSKTFGFVFPCSDLPPTDCNLSVMLSDSVRILKANKETSIFFSRKG